MKKIFFFLNILISTFIFAQTKIDGGNTNLSTITDSLGNNHILFDLHVGYGTFSGGRIGARVFPIDNLSFEISYGRDWTNFLGLSDEIVIYNFGINWKYDTSDLLTYCLNIKYHYRLNLSDPGYLGISPSIGVMDFKSSGLTFWYRAGIFTAIYSFQENRFGFYNIGLNLDVGIAFNIQN